MNLFLGKVINILEKGVANLTKEINDKEMTEMTKNDFITMINKYKNKLIKVLESDFLKENAESTGSTGSGRRLKKHSRRHNKKRGKRTRAYRN